MAALLAEGSAEVGEADAKAILAAYGIPVVRTESARDGHEAAAAARRIGCPVALKVLSPDLVHKSDVSGVALDLADEAALTRVLEAIMERVRGLVRSARLAGFTVQAMARRPRAHGLIVGVAVDPVFGPVVLFGQGGVAVEVTRGQAIRLPPLNRGLAADLVSRTRVARLLAGFRDQPRADLDAFVRYAGADRPNGC